MDLPLYDTVKNLSMPRFHHGYSYPGYRGCPSMVGRRAFLFSTSLVGLLNLSYMKQDYEAKLN